MSDDQGKYGFGTRPDMLPYVPLRGRLLEVGCASGGFAHTLRHAGFAGQMWGIEPDPHAAAQAVEQFDRVIVGLYPDDIPEGEQFDVVVFNDVLEHMVDPWDVLRRTAAVLSSGATVVASIPNIRYWPVLKNLALRGSWTYTETGTLDRTHLRFFTRETISDMFSETGYVVDKLEPTNVLTMTNWRGRYMNHLPMDLRALQYAVVARQA